jgi:hypothetical protein
VAVAVAQWGTPYEFQYIALFRVRKSRQKWKPMILPILLSAALQNAEPCSPRMLPMVTTSLPYVDGSGEVAGLIEFTSEASTSGRVLVVTYVRPGIAQVGTFTVEGDAQIQNLTNATANVKYRMSNRIDDGFVPIFDQGSPLCWDAEKQRIICDYVFEVPGQSEITVPVDWSVTIRRKPTRSQTSTLMASWILATKASCSLTLVVT